MSDSSDPPVILIVDDEPHVCTILAESFADKPWHVETANSGAAAIEICRRSTVDVVVLDKNLPDMSGVKLFWRLRNEGHPVACIMITGYSSADSAVEMLNLGVSAYFEKPFADVFLVRERIEMILEDRTRRRVRVRRRVRQRKDTAPLPSSQRVTPLKPVRLKLLAASADSAVRNVIEHTLFSKDDLQLVASKRALEVELADGDIDLVILDGSVATTTLPALVSMVRQRVPDVAIVLIAKQSNVEVIKELIDLGVDVLIEHPINAATFRSATADLLGHLRGERAARG